jgi:hypothetical protein
VAYQSAARAIREEQQVRKAKARQAASDEKERKRLQVEDRKEEAASAASALQERIAGLGLVLTAGVRPRPVVTFASLKWTAAFPAFTAGGLDRSAPQPQWEQFAPHHLAGWAGRDDGPV